MKCPIDGCKRQIHDIGLCGTHAWHKRKFGDPLAGPVKNVGSVPDRLEARIHRTETCWLWTGMLNDAGYGILGIKHRATRVHRLIWEMTNGPVPEGLELDHLCRVRHCCNPNHLEAVTHKVNMLRSNTPSAQNARKTHCPKGHPYDEANTYVQHLKRGGLGRVCRACQRARLKT